MASDQDDEWLQLNFDKPRVINAIYGTAAMWSMVLENTTNPPNTLTFTGITSGGQSNQLGYITDSFDTHFWQDRVLSLSQLYMSNNMQYTYKALRISINHMLSYSQYPAFGELAVYFRKYDWNTATHFLVPEQPSIPESGKSWYIKIHETAPNPYVTILDRVQSLEITRDINSEHISELTLMCSTNSDLIEQIGVILDQLTSIPLDYGLGQILLWTTSGGIPSNATVLTSSAQQLLSSDYADLYNLFNADNLVFGDVFQIPYMTDASTPAPYSASAVTESDTACHALNSGTSSSADDLWQGTTRNGSWFRVDFGGYYRIVELAFRTASSAIGPTNFRIEGINSDDTFTTLKTWSNQSGFSTSTLKVYTLPVVDAVYKGIRLYCTTMVSGYLGFRSFLVTLQPTVMTDYFSIPAQPSVPPNGKQWIMITSSA
jgi:hypothetical protein